MHRHERPCGASCRFCARFLSRPPTAARSPRHILRRTYRHAARRHTAHRHAREGGHPRVEPLLPCCLEGSCSMHPRSRGATPAPGAGTGRSAGLSPLTRGNRDAPRAAPMRAGPIPAHAGQPDASVWSSVVFRAYPRSRGATWRLFRWTMRHQGLSPLTRGNLGRPDRPRRVPGPIPAHAGQPRHLASHQPARRAYPRSRGATRIFAAGDRVVEGLSPLTRGNRAQPVVDAQGGGPIPAHAGQP